MKLYSYTATEDVSYNTAGKGTFLFPASKFTILFYVRENVRSVWK
jgi:hypothetical protein